MGLRLYRHRQKKTVKKAAPVVAVSTTSGTGTETDPYCVITKTDTNEKLDFAVDAIFPKISVIDPELMVSLPRSLTLYQGFDALFHAAECYITNQNKNRLVDVFAKESIEAVSRWLPAAAEDGKNIEARTRMAYAADICSGYTQALINTTSHHIIAQTMGGLFPGLPHGASLILIAEAYYKKVMNFFPETFDELGKMMGEQRDENCPGSAFLKGLTKLMDKTGMRTLAMSSFGITPDSFDKIADITVNVTGISEVDLYTLTVGDIVDILKRSYR